MANLNLGQDVANKIRNKNKQLLTLWQNFLSPIASRRIVLSLFSY